MWKMRMVSRFGQVTDIENPLYIPRKGERIIGIYEPTPVVTDVLYNYAEKTVTVYVE